VPEVFVAIGLDIDDKSVKFAKLKQTENDIFLLKYAVREISASENKITATANILKEFFNDEKSDTPVYTCVYGPNVSLKHLLIPVIPDEELNEALKWEAKNIIPFPLENASIDYYKIGQHTNKVGEKFELILGAAAENVIKSLNDLAKESGIKFSGASVCPFALHSLVVHNKNIGKDEIIAIIDIGAEAASINLFKGDALQLTREITVAGDAITKAMTGLLVADRWQLNLTYEQAEEIKKKYGIPKKDTNEITDTGVPLIHIFEMMAPTLRRLQNEIQRSFDYYREEFRVEKIDRVFITGGSSRLKNLEEYLSNALGLKVETINPFEKISIDPSSGIKAEDADKASFRLSLAIGLALDKCKRINFLKKKEKTRTAKNSIDELLKKINIKVKIPPQAAIWSLIILLLLAVSYYIYLAKKENYYKQDLASKQLILSDVKELVEKRMILDQIAKEETHIRETLSQVTQVIPEGIILTSLIYDNSKKQIWLSGEAKNTKTVGRLLKNFEDSPNFKKTTLIEARKTVIESVPQIIFKITFNLT